MNVREQQGQFHTVNYTLSFRRRYAPAVLVHTGMLGRTSSERRPIALVVVLPERRNHKPCILQEKSSHQSASPSHRLIYSTSIQSGSAFSHTFGVSR